MRDSKENLFGYPTNVSNFAASMPSWMLSLSGCVSEFFFVGSFVLPAYKQVTKEATKNVKKEIEDSEKLMIEASKVLEEYKTKQYSVKLIVTGPTSELHRYAAAADDTEEKTNTIQVIDLPDCLPTLHILNLLSVNV